MSDTNDRAAAAGDSDFAAMIPAVRMSAGWTLGGLAAGFAIGLALAGTAWGPGLAAGVEAVGGLWLRGLQMAIIPLVATLVVTGVVQTVAAASAGAMARRTLALFVVILSAGTVMAALAVPAVLDRIPVPAGAALSLRGAQAPAQAVPGFADFLNSVVPTNVIDAAARDAVLPTVLFFILLAAAITRLPERPRQLLSDLFAALAAALLVVIGWVLRLAPIGVFALALGVAARSGTEAIAALGHYIVTITAVGTVVMLAGYGVAVWAGRLRLGAFARALLPVQAVALSTQSSLASLPAMLAACRSLGVRSTSAEFVLPLAVALFRATGPAMNLGVAIYVARLTGVVLSPAVLLTGVVMALVTAPSSVSLPGSISFVTAIGPIALAMGVPVGPLGLLVAVELLPDLMRTLGNVTMDVAVTAAVDRATADRSDGAD
ncbi:dicarboxylate/amino acid:cation symporter [Novosphingobium piscinae]|uniref:Cation:dicarboxylase symporter family transporter n=1 Tax=Novosphingobium piscinae TaxID=1507448 RepID=A0A7X1FZQ5_9SPHN|nr:cation:dicarboxylase symporter family transporter [Novosphingobium piscinae]MBC2669978.1 cation:dicarboxylase symporter family transporter [Novosphingobium piscinae]